MGRKLYVGNLAYGVTSSDLETLLGAHGTVRSAEVISDRATGQSKGFGFCEMESDAEAQAAIAALNGHELEGRKLTVNEAKPREPRSGGFGGGGGGGRGSYGGGGRGGRYEAKGPDRDRTTMTPHDGVRGAGADGSARFRSGDTGRLRPARALAHRPDTPHLHFILLVYDAETMEGTGG